jgi:hypothetical protein
VKKDYAKNVCPYASFWGGLVHDWCVVGFFGAFARAHCPVMGRFCKKMSRPEICFSSKGG